jgi:hypothetical protein
LATGAAGDARRARSDYLEPLLRRFPKGKHAEEARAEIARMDMELAEARLRNKLKLGQELQTEGDRLLAEAWQFQQFGDAATALEKFESMLDILPEDAASRTYRNIAGREIEKLRESGVSADRKAFLQQRLQTADEQAEKGNTSEAQRIWRSVITLYRGNPELADLVAQAEERLAAQKNSEEESEPEPDSAS